MFELAGLAPGPLKLQQNGVQTPRPPAQTGRGLHSVTPSRRVPPGLTGWQALAGGAVPVRREQGVVSGVSSWAGWVPESGDSTGSSTNFFCVFHVTFARARF